MSQVTLLTHVDLNVNKIDDCIATDIGNFMANNTEITEVRFSKLQLQHNGYKKLSKYLEKIKGLKFISIRNSNPSITTLTKLINNNEYIKHLNLSNCSISIQEMLQLSQILQDVFSLRYLDFSHVHITDSQVVQNIINVIFSNTKLKYLQLAGCKLNASHITKIIAALKFCNDLVLLNLSHNNIVSISIIKEFTELLINIQYLYLANCSLGAPELQNITASLNMTSSINCNASSSLKLLDLRFNNIQKSCSQKEADLIISMILNRKLQRILLPNFDALSLQLFVNKLSNVNCLQHLDFGSNEITDELASEVVALITSSNYVNLEQLRISKLVLHQDDLICLSKNKCKLNIRGINYLHMTGCVFNHHAWHFITNVIIKNKNSIVGLIFIDCVVPEKIGEVIGYTTKLQHLKLININVIKDVSLMENDITCSLTESKILADPLRYRKKLLLLNLSDNYLDGQAVEQMLATIATFTALEYLVLANCGLTAKEIKYFTKLCTLTKLKHIDLRCNAITDEGVGPVAKLISSTNQLQYLNLSNCEFHLNGIYVIVDVLKANANLEHLDLSLNGKVSDKNDFESATNEIFEQIIDVILRNLNMQYLKFPRILLSNEQLKYLFEIAASKGSFKSIDLGQNTVDDKLAADLAAVLSSNTMEQLIISEVELKHNFSIIKHHLKKIRGLLSLSIICCDLTDEDANIIISTIANNDSIQRFDLCDCTTSNISDGNKLKLTDVLASVNSLEYLSLNNFICTAKITKALANVITCNTKLKNIELPGCNLGREGFTSVVSAINQCKNVVLINLSYNVNIGETGFRIYNAFKLTHINVTACNFVSRTIIELCEALYSCKSLKYLNLSQNLIVSKVANEVASLLSVLTNLEYLSLYDCQLAPTSIKSIAAKLKELSTLQYVYLNLNKMTHDTASEIAAMISNNKNMRKFALPDYDKSYVEIKVILRALKSNSSLQYLDISSGQVFLNAAYELGAVLANNTNLQQVLLSQLTLGPNEFKKLSSYLSRLRELRYLAINLCVINDENADNVVRVITNNPAIEKLNLSGCEISLQGKIHIFQALTSLGALQYFSINDIAIRDQFENDLTKILSKNVMMKHLEMGNCVSKLTECGIYKIMMSLENHKQLRHFNFNSNIIADNNLSVLSNLIRDNKLEHLELSQCNITSLDSIFNFLSMTTLKHIDLSCNPISNIVTTTRQHELTRNPCLTHLNLFECRMSEETTAQVIKYLTQCRLLNYLNLSSNLLKSNSSAVNDLVTVISNNKSIETLCLPDCALSDLNIKAIFLSLQNTSSLRFLDLNSNKITNEVADAVAAMMINNSNLDQLKFSNLVLEERGFEVLKFYLPKFKGITHLSITGFKFTDEDAENISILIKNNVLIQNLIICNCIPKHLKCLQSIFITMKNLKNLQRFCFIYNYLTLPPHVIDDLATVISLNIKLKAIGLGGCALTEGNIIAVIKAIKYPHNISHLRVENTFISTPLMMILSDLQVGSLGLEQLTLSNCKVTGEELSHWQGISGNSKLKYLNVSNNPISMLGAELIQNIIINTKQLQYLNLSNCMLHPKQLDWIIVQLKDIDTLLYLNISGNKLRDGTASKLIAVIIKNTTIQHLYFSNCSLKDSEVKDLLNVIKHKTCVKCIDVSLNEINSAFTKEIIDVVTSNRCLQWIMFPKLELSQHELQILSKTLPLMRKLEHLSIIGGEFTNIDACNVATLINNNKSLKYLNISNCIISDNEKFKIFMAMKSVNSLTHLIINNIVITDQVKDEILIVIANNTELQHIEITGCLNTSFVRRVSTIINSHKCIIFSNIS